MALWLALAVGAYADQVTVLGKAQYGVRVLGLDQGRLQFRGADGILQQVWVEDVDLLQVDRGGLYADINEAERFRAKGDTEGALVRYRRALKTLDGFWPELVEMRMVQVCDRPELIDQAAAAYIRVARFERSGPTAAVRIIPASKLPSREAKSVKALEALDAAIEKDPAGDRRLALVLFRYDLLRRMNDARAATEARDVTAARLPSGLRCRRVDEIMLAALGDSFDAGGRAEDWAALDDLIRECSEQMLPSALLLKGRAQLAAAHSSDDLVRAIWPFLRVAIHMPADVRAADGFLGAAQGLFRLGRTDDADRLLKNCMAHPGATVEVKNEAQALMDRLQKGPSPSKP